MILAQIGRDGNEQRISVLLQLLGFLITIFCFKEAQSYLDSNGGKGSRENLSGQFLGTYALLNVVSFLIPKFKIAFAETL